jgi:hypothetical protein
MSDSTLWRSLSTWIYAGSSFVSFACEIAILVAIATIVRRHRPDAYRGLQTWAILSLAVFVVFTMARSLLPSLASSTGGIETFFKVNSLITIGQMGTHVVLVILFIRGLVALAQPPKPVVVEGTPPYR